MGVYVHDGFKQNQEAPSESVPCVIKACIGNLTGVIFTYSLLYKARTFNIGHDFS